MTSNWLPLANLIGPAGPAGPPGDSLDAAKLADMIRTLDSDVDLALTEKYGTIVKATDERFGAVCDVEVDSGAAINAAISHASAASAFLGLHVVFLPKAGSGYLSNQSTILKTGVVLRGEDHVLLKRGGTASSVFVNATNQERVGVEGLTLDAAGKATAATVRASGTTHHMTVLDVHFRDSVGQPVGAHAFDAQSGTGWLRVESNDFDNLPNNIRLTGDVKRAELRKNTFTNWSERCIYVIGNASAGTTDLILDRNYALDYKAGGTVRQAFTIQGAVGADTVWHENTWLNGNVVIGPDKSYTHPTDPGTADQISVHRTRNLRATENVSLYGGDVGMTFSVGTRQGTIFGNVSLFNDTYGMALGATGADVGWLTVIGNILMNNGQNRNGDRSDRARVGAALNDCSHSVFLGNVTGDNQAEEGGTGTQLYGYSILNTTDITFGPDAGESNLVGHVYDAGGNTGTKYTLTELPTNLPPAPTPGIVKPAATVRNNTATFAPDEHLVNIPVKAGVSYLINMGLFIDSSTVADFKLQLVAPAGSVLSISPNSFASTATAGSASAVINRSRTSTTVVIGAVNAGTDTTGHPIGSLIAGADGVVSLEWAQNTQEATDTRLEAGSWLALTPLGV